MTVDYSTEGRMRTFLAGVVVSAAAMLLFAPVAGAHFKLLEPASWLVENNQGDPQKMAPCGGTSADAGMPSNMVNKVQGGSKLHIKVQETIFHPGFYRIALAVNSRAELPPDPQPTTVPTDKGPR